MSIRDKAKEVFNDVDANKIEYYVKMLVECSNFEEYEARSFIRMFMLSNFNSIDRYWRQLAPKNKKNMTKENEYCIEFSN